MRHLFIVLIMFVTCSCASKKMIVHSVVSESEIISDSSKSTSSSVSSVFSVLSTLSDSFSIETITRVYDTSVIPDSLGHYPIKSETIQRVHRVIGKKDISFSSSIKAYSSRTDVHEKSKSKVVDRTIQKTKPVDQSGPIILLVILVASILIYFFILRKW